jgi:hypothetical protein
MVFIIAYDLLTPNDTPADYERVIGAIKNSFGTWCHLQKSVWMVESALTAAEIRDTLRGSLYGKDVLFVARLHGNWASWALGEERNRWLKSQPF